jgi:hypothetical protein
MMAKKKSSICVEVLYCFEALSGLRINLGKSGLVAIGDVDDVDDLANILGCRVASLPMKYLGLLLGASYKSTSIWIGVWMEEIVFVKGCTFNSFNST